MGVELAAVRGHSTNVQQDLDSERTRGEQLSLEILTLVNQKGVVEKELSQLHEKCEAQAKRVADSDSEMTTLRRTLEAVQGKLSDEHGMVEKLREEKVEADITVRQTEVAYKEKKLEIEQSMTEFSRERDREVVNLKKGEEEETRRYHEMTQQLERQIKSLEEEADHEDDVSAERNVTQKFDISNHH